MHRLLRRVALTLTGAAIVGVSACEPANVTAARNDLQRGGARTFTLSLPIALDTFGVADFLPAQDTATTPTGLAGVTVSPESVTVQVGDELRFDNVNLASFAFGFEQMLRTSPSTVSVPLPAAGGLADTLRFSTPGGSHILSATVDTGTVARTMANATACDATVTLTLVDSTGATVLAFPPTTVPAGATMADSLRADGKRIAGYVRVVPVVGFGACVPAGGTQVTTDAAFRAMTLASVGLTNINEQFDQTYDPLTTEPRLAAVDTVVVDSGGLVLRVQNRLPIAVNVTWTLHGVTRGGSELSGVFTIPAAPGDGSTVTQQATVDLAGATMVTGQVVGEVVAVAQAASATITPTTATDAIALDASGSFAVRRLAGALDPAKTPDLAVNVEDSVEVDSASIDFGDFTDAVKSATINDAAIDLTLENTADAPITLTGVTFGLVPVTPSGALARTGSGQFAYETDSTTGTPILLPVVGSGGSPIVVPRRGSASVTLQAAPLVDRLVHLLLDGQRVALVTVGTATAGDGQPSAIAAGDVVGIRVNAVVGLDVTLPAAGVTITRNQTISGLGLNPTDADQIAQRLLEATAFLAVTNGTPFAVDVDVAVSPGGLGNADIFSRSDAVHLAPVSLAAPVVDGSGVVTTPAYDTAQVTLTGTQTKVFFGDSATAGIRIHITPPAGSGGRGAIRSTDRVYVDAHAEATVQSGGGS
jgi:hypothetical protein